MHRQQLYHKWEKFVCLLSPALVLLLCSITQWHLVKTVLSAVGRGRLLTDAGIRNKTEEWYRYPTGYNERNDRATGIYGGKLRMQVIIYCHAFEITLSLLKFFLKDRPVEIVRRYSIKTILIRFYEPSSIECWQILESSSANHLAHEKFLLTTGSFSCYFIRISARIRSKVGVSKSLDVQSTKYFQCNKMQ